MTDDTPISYEAAARGSRRNWKSSGPMHWSGHQRHSASMASTCPPGTWRPRERGRQCPLLAGQSLNGHSPRWVSASSAEASWQTSSSWAAPLWPWLTTLPASPAMSMRCSSRMESSTKRQRVANDLGLPRWWLNEQASTYISGKDDTDKRRVFDHPGLRVMAASPRHIFAMKARAARTRDIDDLRLLAGIVGVDSADAALQICANFYPDEPVSPRSAAVLRELFG